MGVSTDGILAYGWDLGGDDREVGWAAGLVERLETRGDVDDLVLEAAGADLGPDPWGELEGRPHAWFYAGGECTPEYAAWLERTKSARAARRQARRAALAAADLELVSHCSDGSTMWILTAPGLHWLASRGDALDVGGDVALLATPAGLSDARDRLRAAARLLGLEPDGPPALLLASYWG